MEYHLPHAKLEVFFRTTAAPSEGGQHLSLCGAVEGREASLQGISVPQWCGAASAGRCGGGAGVGGQLARDQVLTDPRTTPAARRRGPPPRRCPPQTSGGAGDIRSGVRASWKCGPHRSMCTNGHVQTHMYTPSSFTDADAYDTNYV